MAGGSASGLTAFTEFSLPGVPPLLFTLAFQFCNPVHGARGSIISRLQPPWRLISLPYQSAEYLTACITMPVSVISVIASPELSREGKLVTEMVVPNWDNCATALAVQITTMLSDSRTNAPIGPL